MKKTLSIALVIILLLSGLFILTGCNNDNKEVKENKNVDKYEIEASYGKLSFEIAKDTGYEFEAGTNNCTLTHNDNKSTIKMYLMDTSKSSIIMKETDFSSSTYTDYKQFEVNGKQAFSIRKSNNFEVKIGILLDEYDKEHGKNHGISIVVSQNALKTKEFDPEAFVNSEVFQNLLNSIKLELNNVDATE